LFEEPVRFSPNLREEQQLRIRKNMIGEESGIFDLLTGAAFDENPRHRRQRVNSSPRALVAAEREALCWFNTPFLAASEKSGRARE